MHCGASFSGDEAGKHGFRLPADSSLLQALEPGGTQLPAFQTVWAGGRSPLHKLTVCGVEQGSTASQAADAVKQT